ncbi:MAG: hypothetical protein GX363_01800 [Clostridiales bacterium]|jgi:hypothetical protein|nr:hypothetical protein [Clostridiales bacterium]
MKVFIVFIGLLILNVTFITYQGDLNRYVQLQNYLKAVAEECASGASLYYDEEAYSEGLMVINRVEAIKYVEDRVGRAFDSLNLEEKESLSYDIEIIDDSSGESLSPYVIVTLRLNTNDLFRLSFLKVNRVVRSAKYELVDYGGG